MASLSSLKWNKWADSDQNFLKKVTGTSREDTLTCNHLTSFDDEETVWPVPASVERIQSRQRFLNSYKFSTNDEERKMIQRIKDFVMKKKYYLHKKLRMVTLSIVRFIKTK
nr:hypothetical protein [Tanacetum cinerariifolium]